MAPFLDEEIDCPLALAVHDSELDRIWNAPCLALNYETKVQWQLLHAHLHTFNIKKAVAVPGDFQGVLREVPGKS